MSSVGLVRAGDRFQGRGHVPKLRLGEAPGEVLPDASEVGPCSAPEHLPTALRQCRKGDPSVPVEPTSLDEPSPFETVHQAGQAAGGEEHAVGEVGHAQPPIGSPGQAKEHVVAPEAQSVLVELRIELPNDVVMGVKERLPRSELGLGQPLHEVSVA